ncbi:MAG: triose-phosphate isomerase [Oscillospiraceae bacterium]|nr:triose-phosphate isomerase [Oscillospiraceae bacterium]MBP3672205.1 triose-phosphate isomerase [Oscillospiraceae bacterium]MBP3674399.1 triose-phosphate isomerase [Oscillospiraceae bacterium]
MKKLYFGTNLKMYKNIADTVSYLQKLVENTKDISREEIELFVIPSFTTLQSATEKVDRAYVKLGAQNMCWEEQGQFTGEISPLMLGELGLDLVMIGHSERRHVFGETDYEENKKVLCALNHGFTTLLCIGETDQEKEYGISNEVLRTQLIAGFHGVTPEMAGKLWVAYEPVWAIGVNGKPASVEYAEEKHQVIKQCLVELFGEEVGLSIPVLYGGSVNPGNANQLIAQPSIDGLFTGRSAWQADAFDKLIRDAMASAAACGKH